MKTRRVDSWFCIATLFWRKAESDILETQWKYESISNFMLEVWSLQFLKMIDWNVIWGLYLLSFSKYLIYFKMTLLSRWVDSLSWSCRSRRVQSESESRVFQPCRMCISWNWFKTICYKLRSWANIGLNKRVTTKSTHMNRLGSVNKLYNSWGPPGSFLALGFG